MGLANIYFENQALEKEDLPPRVLYTVYPILGEMGSKKQPFSPLSYIGLSKASVKFDPNLLEAPSMHTFLIYESPTRNDNTNYANAVLADPRNTKGYLSKLIKRSVTVEQEIKTVYDKISFIQYKINEVIARYDFIESINISSMNKVRIIFKDDELAIATTMINQYIMEELIACATPKGFALRPIGLGGRERFVNMSVLQGYKGLFTYLAPEVPPLQGRYPLTWTLSAFLQILYLLPESEGGLNENSLIKAGFLMEQLLKIGLGFETIEDAIQILPWFSRWTLRPSFPTLKAKKLLEAFVLKLFVLGRYLFLMRSVSVETMIYPTRWKWTGKTLASTEYLEGCFRGTFNTSISGLESIWAWPASSMYLKMGEWQIMGMSVKKRNFWHQMGSVNEMKVRSGVVFVEDKDVDFPNLIDEGYDAMLVSLEPNMKRARQEEIYHIESEPPRTILKAEWIGPNDEKSRDNIEDVLQSILVGGQPLFNADLLVEFPHSVINYEHINLNLKELEDVHKARKAKIIDGIVHEKLDAAINEDSRRRIMYEGDELNTIGNGKEMRCPYCNELFDARGISNHIKTHERENNE
jgi:hypothetical protein